MKILNSLFYALYISSFANSATLSFNKREDCKSNTILNPTNEGNPYYSVLPLDSCPICPESTNCNDCKSKIEGTTTSVRNTRFWSKILLGFDLNKDKKIISCKLTITPVPEQANLSSNTIVNIHSTTSFDQNNITWNNSPKDNDLISTLDTTNPQPIDVTKYCQGEHVYFSIVKNDEKGPENIQFYSSKSSSPPKLEVEYE